MGLVGRNGRKFGGEVGGTKPEREEIALCAGAGGCGWIRPAWIGGQSGKLGLAENLKFFLGDRFIIDKCLNLPLADKFFHSK